MGAVQTSAKDEAQAFQRLWEEKSRCIRGHWRLNCTNEGRDLEAILRRDVQNHTGKLALLLYDVQGPRKGLRKGLVKAPSLQ